MLTSLKKLKIALLQLRDLETASKIAQMTQQLQKLPQHPAGEIPDFNWLLQGKLFKKVKKMDPAAYEAFIEANSDVLSNFDVKKYLGSGMIGDAWELDDGTVLKIFDNGAQVGKASDVSKYQNLMEKNFDGTADNSIPMVYQVQEFNLPEGFEEATDEFSNRNDAYFQPAFVILEKVQSFEENVKNYGKHNTYRLDPKSEQFSAPLSPELMANLPPEIKEWFSDINTGEEYASVLQEYLEQIMMEIIKESKQRYLLAESVFESGDHDETFPQYLNTPENSQGLTRHIEKTLQGYRYLNNDSRQFLEQALGLQPGWLPDLIKAIISNLALGRFDLHPGNFGFRNGKVVFYDG